MRAFVAVDISSPVRARIEELENELRPQLLRARFVPVRNLHFTLRFLGESEPEQLESMAAELEGAVCGVPGFVLDVKGCGAFPSPRRPRILWVGIENPPRPLFDLQGEIERVARRAGFAPEARPFEPHLTVARFREPPRGLEAVLTAVRDRELGTSAVEEVVVYESRLSPNGATYTPLHRIALAAESGTRREGLV